MSDPTDPRNIAGGIAAGTSGGAYGFMQVAISDKAAKDFSKGMSSIEESGKKGIFVELTALYEKMIDAAGLMQPFVDFLTLFSAMMTGAFGQSLAALYEGLFSDHNIENMEKAAAAGKDLDRTLGPAIKRIFELIEATDNLGKKIPIITDVLENDINPALLEFERWFAEEGPLGPMVAWIDNINESQREWARGAGLMNTELQEMLPLMNSLDKAIDDVNDEIKDAVKFWEDLLEELD